MKCKKNNLGFTLIELLITVAIMLSILIISITSITGVDKRKKEEAYRQVKNTIETAAEQYVTSNEYLFKGTSNAKIPLKYLIDKGYLNKIVDPRSGKTINECTYVNIVKDGNKIKVGEFVAEPDSSDCNLERTYENPADDKIDLNPAKINVKFMCGGEKAKTDSTGWYNSNSLKDCLDDGLSVKITIEKDDCDDVKLFIGDNKVKDYIADPATCRKKRMVKEADVYDYDTFASDSNYKEQNYKIIYLGGSSTDVTMKARIDTVPPAVTLDRNRDEVDFKYTAKDENGSGLAKYKYSGEWNEFESNCLTYENKVKEDGKCNSIKNIFAKKSETAKNVTLQVQDVAGNVGKASKDAYKACSSNKQNKTTSVYFLGWQDKVTSKTTGKTRTSCNVYKADDGEDYYVAYYRYHSYQCDCSIDTKVRKYCKLEKYTEDSDSGHAEYKLGGENASETDYISRIYYRKTDKGLKACQKHENQYVAYMCSLNKGNVKGSANGSIAHHGYQWNYDSNSKKTIKNFRKYGWYHSGGCFEYNYSKGKITWANSQEDLDNIIKSQCAIACKKEAGQITYKEDGNFKDCVDSGN